MKHSVTWVECDVCGKETDTYHEYKFDRKWFSGSHSGWSEKIFHVCVKCENLGKLRYLWLRWKPSLRWLR